LEDRTIARFPGARGRIPNFVVAEQAAERLASLEAWKQAWVIEANPDTPQWPVRERAVRGGKMVYMAVPQLRDQKPFIELDPARLHPCDLQMAASIGGAFQFGRHVSLDEMRPVDLMIVGSVAVSRDGARLGKGGGYSDLGFAISRASGLIGPGTPIVTTVHPLQIVELGEIEMTSHDLPVDVIVTPNEVINTHHRFERPSGIHWVHLSGEKVAAIPVLSQFRR
jgi:5-formyltetrahydrofolate cyclo-ligase